MSAATEIKAEPPDETPVPAPTVTLTGQDRADRELQECNAEKCSEDLRKLREEALAEGQFQRNCDMQRQTVQRLQQFIISPRYMTLQA